MRHTIHDMRDANEAEIVQALENLGCLCVALKSTRKGGIPDLLVGIKGRWVLVEVKNPKGRNRIHQSQQEFLDVCQSRGLPAHVIRTVPEAIKLVQP